MFYNNDARFVPEKSELEAVSNDKSSETDEKPEEVKDEKDPSQNISNEPEIHEHVSTNSSETKLDR